jgi:hypothetical protein
LVNEPTACAGGEYSNVTITVIGSSLCNATTILGLSSIPFGNVYGDMANNEIFYISDGTDGRTFQRNGSAQSGTPLTTCSSCPAPTPTATDIVPTSTPTSTPIPPTDTPTPTSTPIPPTPTPTPTPDPNFYYEADRYECQLNGSCLNVETIVIANDIELVLNARFRLDPETGYIFQVVNSTTPQIALLTTMTGLGVINCSSLCTQPATPTPTSTPVPDPTPTPVPDPTSTPVPDPTSTPVPPPTSTPVPDPTATPVPPTPTPTSEPPTSYQYQLGPSYTQANIGTACSNIGTDFFTEVYAATDQPGDVVQFFTNVGLTSGYGGESEYHAYFRTGGFTTYTAQVSPSGFVTDKSICP